MVRKLFAFIFLGGFGIILYNLFDVFAIKSGLGEVSAYYAQNATELGAANLVTAVVVTYRGLDTLGEVTILFVTAAIISFFLRSDSESSDRKVRETSILLQSASSFLVPLIFMFGAYIFINGHLTPGGGFQGGAVMASGLVLMFLAQPLRKAGTMLISIAESISGVAYVFLGLAGIFLAGGFLDNRVISLGEYGTLLSAGLIPVIYIFIGLKVGSELSAIIIQMHTSQNELQKEDR
jgi:multicomponent Na+:H+ antiporter subunit B